MELLGRLDERMPTAFVVSELVASFSSAAKLPGEPSHSVSAADPNSIHGERLAPSCETVLGRRGALVAGGTNRVNNPRVVRAGRVAEEGDRDVEVAAEDPPR